MSNEVLTGIFTDVGKEYGFDSADSEFVAFRDFV